MHKYVIVMATYNRQNRKTPEYLNNSLNSIYDQKCEDWDLILVGDKYEPYEELEKMVNDFKTKLAENNKQNQVILINNQEVERDHIKNKVRLWNCAGARSINKGLELARNSGYKYYLHLDDDDLWYPNHIENINKVYEEYENCIFINTLSTYKGGYLPVEKVDIYPNNLLPKPCGMIHSSYSFRIDVVPFYYFTSFNENEIRTASDAFMLYNIREFLLKNTQYCCMYIPVLSCRHDIEGESLK